MKPIKKPARSCYATVLDIVNLFDNNNNVKLVALPLYAYTYRSMYFLIISNSYKS
jgi:hypothetical protein